ncbi:unnamed protein product [Echinostoma caproni]|uniref:Uncharacterized protein n=1 Tax=Echinostoma caproni TaxID=27848 RepID=A0A183ATA4_9TREM|nr:unnamed protein product [Echinostoma caproni]
MYTALQSCDFPNLKFVCDDCLPTFNTSSVGRGVLPLPSASGLVECAQQSASAEAPPTDTADEQRRPRRRRAINNVRPTSSESRAAAVIESGSPAAIQTLPEPPVSLPNANSRSYARVAAASHSPNSAVTSVTERPLTQPAS